MKKSFLYALVAVLVIALGSCGKQSRQTVCVTPCASNPIIDDDTLSEGWVVDSLYTHICADNTQRLFVDVYFHVPDFWEDYHALFAVDDNPKDTTYVWMQYPRYEGEDDFFAYIGGVPDHLLYLPCEDNNSLYVVTQVNANSNGWTAEYQLFIVDMETIEAQYIADFAAIEVVVDGFRIAAARLTNEDTATCTADEVWVLHDEYLDWSGKVIRVDSEEYDYQTMKDKYQNGKYTYVKGFYGFVK